MSITIDQLRQQYLEYFKQKGHVVIPSAPLLPENDPTTLFISSGMQPLIQYFLGAQHPQGTRIVNSQKCLRSQDIDEVGDNRHTTFFEMLGNWSFGEYFKQEQIEWVFAFVTKILGLDPKRLYVTVFAGSEELGIPQDDTAIAMWQKQFATVGLDASVVLEPQKAGLQDGRICVYQWENWWSRVGKPATMPAGEPGGPDSELFFDFGVERKLHEQSIWKDQPCHLNCDCGRFMEVGNSVFMQYVKQVNGNFEELPNKNVDFGGGLERLMAAISDEPDVFLLPFFSPIISTLEQLSGKSYEAKATDKKPFRVIADHVRAAVMIVADGVVPSNKDQGYVARRLIRRAVRFAHRLGITKPFLANLVDPIAQIYQEPYPELLASAEKIKQVLSGEETKFARTLKKGEDQLRKILLEKAKQKLSGLTPEDAFYLYESFGFPLELTQEIVAESFNHDDQIQSDAFSQAFATLKKAHADRSRTTSAGQFRGGLQDSSERTTRYHTATHLLHASLRKVLGTEVQQKGSHITAERLRFDYAYGATPTDRQIKEVIEQINNWVTADLPVRSQQMSKSEALEKGALAFFAEKYPEIVQVYTIGVDQENDWISKELCGGPHVKKTSQIGPLTLIKEQSIGSGVRRIYLRFVE